MDKKKVGIITLYRVRNIGACLQAYAMSQVLLEYGIDTYFIKCYGSQMARELFKGDMGKPVPWTLLFQLKKDLKFRKFFKKYKECNLKDIEDLKIEKIIIGSDSIWISHYGKNYMPNVFFGNIKCKEIYAYAPSIGGKFDKSSYNKNQLLALRKIKSITVRDKPSQELVKAACNMVPNIVVDPTLLYDWKLLLKNSKMPQLIKENSRYILVYGGMSKEFIYTINNYGKQMGYNIINVGFYNRRYRKNIAVSPDEFLHFVNNAELIITSMFHGCMISIALGKNFKYINQGNARTIKLQSTFDYLGIGDTFIINSPEDFEKTEKMITAIDYNSVLKKLTVMKELSLNYIKEWMV